MLCKVLWTFWIHNLASVVLSLMNWRDLTQPLFLSSYLSLYVKPWASTRKYINLYRLFRALWVHCMSSPLLSPVIWRCLTLPVVSNYLPVYLEPPHKSIWIFIDYSETFEFTPCHHHFYSRWNGAAYPYLSSCLIVSPPTQTRQKTQNGLWSPPLNSYVLAPRFLIFVSGRLSDIPALWLTPKRVVVIFGGL